MGGRSRLFRRRDVRDRADFDAALNAGHFLAVSFLKPPLGGYTISSRLSA
ncbi:hypothetical protein NE236_11190 [Actinoallomurus purpureus]|nr:hypothetical protein [Actinoallomurus purpureus]MCO6005545.1 hypothetical protein [Actinoallomurus purpureus]